MIDWPALIRRFDRPQAKAFARMGSHARGDPNPFSDIDLVRFTTTKEPSLPDAGSHLVDGHLVVVSDCSPEEVEKSFIQPEIAVDRIPGLRSGRALRDNDGFFASLQARANAFVWDAAMQTRADAFASQAMMGWVEEVHKALAGLHNGETGRLLDGEFGLTWGLSRLVSTQRGVPLVPLPDGVAWSRDWFEHAEQVVGAGTEWAHLRRRTFGVGVRGPAESAAPLRERVVAGLWLYVATAELLAGVWHAPQIELIDHTVHLIRDTLGDEREKLDTFLIGPGQAPPRGAT